MGEEQSAFMVDVTDLLIDVNEELTGGTTIGRVDRPGEQEADLSLAWAMARSSDEAYSSRSRKNDALRSCSGVFGVSVSIDRLSSFLGFLLPINPSCVPLESCSLLKLLLSRKMSLALQRLFAETAAH